MTQEYKHTSFADLNSLSVKGEIMRESEELYDNGWYYATRYTFKTLEGAIIASCQNYAGFGFSTSYRN